jgi:ribonuclease VapC
LILDTSALVAIVLKEPSWKELLEKIGRDDSVGVATPTLAETGIVLAARLGRDPRSLLARLVEELGLVTIPFSDAHWREAVGAYQRFGKGRHPASLNFGDCLSYAAARLAEAPLLCVGQDFPKTDLTLA